jgi:hypothetical protein
VTEQEAFRDLALKLVESFGQQIVQLVPDVDAVCITLVSSDRAMPLGGIVCHPDHMDSETLLRAIARISDQTEIFARKLLGEDSDAVDTDGKGSTVLAVPGQAERVADAGDGPGGQEGHRPDEAAEADSG